MVCCFIILQYPFLEQRHTRSHEVANNFTSIATNEKTRRYGNGLIAFRSSGWSDTYPFQHDPVGSIRVTMCLDLRSNFEIDLLKSPITPFDASQRDKSDGALMFLLAFMSKSYS